MLMTVAHSLSLLFTLTKTVTWKRSDKLKPHKEVIYQREKLFYVPSCERDLEGVLFLFWSRGPTLLD